jgi:putative oxidoreductase
METYLISTATAVSIGLLIVRIALGLSMAAHGAQKLFGWFGGHGLSATAGMFEHIGFRPGLLLATVATVTEIASGLLMALGFLGAIGPALMVSVMLVATSLHWRNGFFAQNQGIELNVLYITGALALAFTGPGSYSLDALLHLNALSQPGVALAAVAIGILGGVANLVFRRTPVEAKQA